ncbi:hypothetical protein LCGC14_2530390 [marine sediment metagenome]|uniref:Uncharacterized protein n=1 Tax=marine sediment metagenome TaxID=412755 RepID=A0A0F9AU56_9ZZZZ
MGFRQHENQEVERQKEMKNKIAIGIIVGMIFMSCVMSYILAHETTHLLLNQEPTGICIGRCRYFSEEVSPVSGISIATAYFGKSIDLQEELPRTVGAAAAAITGLVTTISIIKVGTTQEKEKRD